MRFIQDLSPETRHLLWRLYKESQHHRVRQRAHCILLSFQGIDTSKLTIIFAVDRITIYNWFDAWEAHRFVGLYDKKGRGRPQKLTVEEQQKAQHYLAQNPQDVKKVVHLIEQETTKRVSTKTIKRLIKKTAISGSASKRFRRKALIHKDMSGVKDSSNSYKTEKQLESVKSGILMSPAFV